MEIEEEEKAVEGLRKKSRIDQVWFPILTDNSNELYKDWIDAEVYDWVWELIKKKDRI